MATPNARELAGKIENTPTGVKLDLTIYTYPNGRIQIKGADGKGWLTAVDPLIAAEHLVYLLRETVKKARRRAGKSNLASRRT